MANNPELIIDITGDTSELQSKLKTLGAVGLTALAGLSASFIALGKNAVGLASNLQEVQNVVDVTFGDNAKQVDEWSKTTQEAFGLSEFQAKKYSSTLGAMLKSSGLGAEETLKLSKSMTQLTGDIASFYNLDHEEAFQKIRAGISGETEPLKQLGIDLSVSKLEAYALAQGLEVSWNTLSAGEQAMLRYSYLMQQTADAQGDFTRTADGFANQTRTMAIEFENLSRELGEVLLPIATKMVEGIRTALSSLSTAFKDSNVKQSIADLGSAFASAFTVIANFTASALPPLISGFSTILNVLRELGPYLLALGTAFAAFKGVTVITGLVTALISATKATGLLTVAVNALNIAFKANPIGFIVTALITLGTALYTLYQTHEGFREGVNAIWNSIVDFVLKAINTLISGYNSLIEKVNEWVGTDFNTASLIESFDGIKLGLESTSSAIENTQGDLQSLEAELNANKLALDSSTDSVNAYNEALASTDASKMYESLDVTKDIAEKTSAVKQSELQSRDTFVQDFSSGLSTGLVDGIIEAGETGSAGMKAIGTNIMDSLLTSMTQYAKTTLTAGIGQLGDLITGGFKSSFGIASPSKVFKQMGVYNMEGLAIGLADGYSMVDKETNSISKSLTSAFSNVSTPSLTGGLSAVGGVSGVAGSNVVVNNINQASGVEVQSTVKETESGIEIENLIISTVSSNISRNGEINRAIQNRNNGSYTVNR